MAENEVKFPVRLVKNRTNSAIYAQFNACILLLRFFSRDLSGNHKTGSLLAAEGEPVRARP